MILVSSWACCTVRTSFGRTIWRWRAAERHTLHEVRLGEFAGGRVSEIIVQPGSPCDGKRISQLVFPSGAMIASVRRGARVVVPNGGTGLATGDVLAVVAQGGGG